jgi:hypothetical protein
MSHLARIESHATCPQEHVHLCSGKHTISITIFTIKELHKLVSFSTHKLRHDRNSVGLRYCAGGLRQETLGWDHRGETDVLDDGVVRGTNAVLEASACTCVCGYRGWTHPVHGGGAVRVLRHEAIHGQQVR